MDIVLAFISLTIFTLMLSNGVNHSFQQLISLSHEPEVLLRSLLAVIVLVPIGVFLLLWVFDLPPAVATGLAVLAAAPGAPLSAPSRNLPGTARRRRRIGRTFWRRPICSRSRPAG